IAITGGPGFVGRHLVTRFVERGDEVLIVTRRIPANAGSDGSLPGKAGVRYISWRDLEYSVEAFEGVEAIVNLAGETINRRWTRKSKERILASRLWATSKLADYVERMNNKPHVIVNASGVGIYGTSERETFTERSPTRRSDFLADVVERWERVADRISGIRVVKLRLGVVLGNDGGAFKTMALPYRLGAGGRVGSGRQWLSWIHITDIVRAVEYCLDNCSISRIVNGVAPNPVTNNEFGRMLAVVLHRPHWLHVPAFAFRLLFGELSMLLLEGQRVIPQVLKDHGFEFKYPTLELALRQLCGSEDKK
ncbi:MAG: hypothetical protein K0R75_3099, partial [Paenibacillaceae bacterium]|nr:hypothetical protein [Paenibacillaceae bacterium]